MNEDIQTDEPIVYRPSRGERLKRSVAARLRRKETKIQKEVHSYKEEKEARERLQAKRQIEKQKKMKVRKDYAMASKKQTA